MRTIKRDIVAGLILSKDKKIWLGRKDPNGGGVYPDYWHLPGGGVDDGETEIKALIRELKEEATLDITPNQIEEFDRAGGGVTEKTLETGETVVADMNFYVYKVRLLGESGDENPVPADDLIDGQWFSEDDIMEQKLTPPTLAFIERRGLSSLFK